MPTKVLVVDDHDIITNHDDHDNYCRDNKPDTDLGL